MSGVYFIADTHWGHKNILKYRPQFSSVEEHDETVFEGILSVANKRAHLWLLGDCFFDTYSLVRLESIVRAFQAVHFVVGNHDTDNALRQGVLRHTIDMCTSMHSLVKYKEFWLSHPPIHPCELRGRVNIHGHMHNQVVGDERYFSVSCEQVGYKPISLDEIRNRIS